MKAKLFVFSLLSLFFLALGVPQLDAQQPSTPPVKINAKFRYSVKFVCGQARVNLFSRICLKNQRWPTFW
ncbi:MAG: hypothetical protein Q8S00_26520, partial [Deltaproteobacteria bacterium]|nr:hypothetical protein [Deltaproteobacteria bacterium]